MQGMMKELGDGDKVVLEGIFSFLWCVCLPCLWDKYSIDQSSGHWEGMIAFLLKKITVVDIWI